MGAYPGVGACPGHYNYGTSRSKFVYRLSRIARVHFSWTASLISTELFIHVVTKNGYHVHVAIIGNSRL